MTSVRQIDFLCTLAMPRTGSTFLHTILRNCTGVNAKEELFHRYDTSQLSPEEVGALAGESGGAITDDASLRLWRAAHPARTLDCVWRFGGRRLLAFKVFPRHLAFDLLAREVFARDDIAFIVLQRRPIDCFISDEKAKSVRRWGGLDTTGMKPVLDAAAFPGWADYHRSWYAWLAEELPKHAAPFVTIGYESHLQSGGLEGAVREVFKALGAIGLGGLRHELAFGHTSLQDREKRYQARVANWEAFERQVRATAKGAALLDWAESVPG